MEGETWQIKGWLKLFEWFRTSGSEPALREYTDQLHTPLGILMYFIIYERHFGKS